jgi:hypothetical protein
MCPLSLDGDGNRHFPPRFLERAADETPLMKPAATVTLDGVEGRFDHFGADIQNKRLYGRGLWEHTRLKRSISRPTGGSGVLRG